jgi:hypothetical protein
MSRTICDEIARWAGGGALSATPGAARMILKDTSSGGSPTANCQADGLKLLLASTSEAEVLTAYCGDILPYDIDDLQKIIFYGCKVGGVDAVTQIAFGLAGAQNDTLDSVAANAWFRLDGTVSTSALVVESDDGTTDVDDKATGLTLSTTGLTLEIDFTTEIKTAGPPSLSKGKQATFWATDANGLRRRVATQSAFDLSALTTGLQPFIQVQKASGTGVPYAICWGIDVHYRAQF